MPLPEVILNVGQHELESHKKALIDFSELIDACIISSDWEELSSVLQDRQHYLEHLFKAPISDQVKSQLKPLAESILQQDQDFQARIQLQKNQLSLEQSSIERSRRAIKAYIDN